MKALIKSFDPYLMSLVMRLPESWHGFFVMVTTLGDPIVTIGIGIIVVMYGWLSAAVRLVISGALIWVTLIVGSLLKLAFGRERPLTEYAANLRVDTFSFPSGHSSGAMIAYGLLAYLAFRLLPEPYGLIVAGVCGVIIFMVGLSRVYLGAHFPSDVLAGWVLGALVLAIVIFIVSPLA